MAKGLKAGDSVTVLKTMRFKPSSDAYHNGLSSIKPGDLGTVLRTGAGRSVVVDFQGKEATISSQRLENRTEPKKGRRGRPKSVPVADENAEVGTVKPKPTIEETGLFNYRDARFVTTIANKLLMSGDTNFESPSVVVEIRLAELPDEVQQQIKSLMQAKLALGPQQNGSAPRKPGRPPKNASTSQASSPKVGRPRGPKPKTTN